MKERKLKQIVASGLVLFFSLFVGLSSAQAQGKQNLRMSTASVGSIMYAFGAAMSDVIEKHNGPKIEILPHNALQGLSMLTTAENDLVMIANDDLSMAYRGKDTYEKITGGKGFDVRVLMLGTRIAAGQVVGGDSGINSYQDLKGKRVVLTFGSSVAQNMGAKAALYAGGLTEDDVTALRTSDVVAAAQMVIDKKADACYGSIGTPVFQEIAAAHNGAKHLGIVDTPENWQKVHEIFAGYFPMTVNPGPLTVKGQPIVLVGRNFTLTARPKLDDQSAYMITKLLWEFDKELGPSHPGLKDWVRANFVSVRAGAPYHPGAIKFYKEVGAWTPELEQHNEKLLSLR